MTFPYLASKKCMVAYTRQEYSVIVLVSTVYEIQNIREVTLLD